LARRCESAIQVIHRRVPTTEIDIQDHPWAKVVNETYAPHFVATQLMVQPQVVSTVNMRYHDDTSPPGSLCRGTFVHVVRDLRNRPSASCKERIPSSEVAAAPIAVHFEYGALDGDIRPFRMILTETKTGEAVAEQTSFELLLGHLHGKNRQWYGMGGAQVARACKLTPPREFIQTVVGQSTSSAGGLTPPSSGQTQAALESAAHVER
jgi:hypothetical protein